MHERHRLCWRRALVVKRHVRLGAEAWRPRIGYGHVGAEILRLRVDCRDIDDALTDWDGGGERGMPAELMSHG